jgi:hypothetical protein
MIIYTRHFCAESIQLHHSLSLSTLNSEQELAQWGSIAAGESYL